MRYTTPIGRRRGDRRIRRGFLFFPKAINGITKWLEIGEWEEELGPHPDLVPITHPHEVWRWEVVRWMDQAEIPFQRFDLKHRPIPPPPPPPLKPTIIYNPRGGWDIEEFRNIRTEKTKEAEMLIQHEEGCTIGTTNLCSCQAKRSIGNLPAADLEAMQDQEIGGHQNAKQSMPPKPSAIHIDPSRIGDLEKFHLPENHAFRAVYRTLTPVEAALSRAIKDQAYQLKKLIEMTPTGWDQRLSVFSLEDSIMRAVRAITQ